MGSVLEIPVSTIPQDSKGFPGGSDSKESACNAGDLGLILGSGRSPGEGKGYSLQYSFQENPQGQRSLAGSIQSMVSQSQTRLSS